MTTETYKAAARLGLVLVVATLVSGSPAAADGDRRNPADPDAGGRWQKLPERVLEPAAPTATEELTEAQRQAMERLGAIGYVAGSVETDRRGVTLHSKREVVAGLNFYASGHGPEAVLMDMNGRVLHRWRKSFEEVWPDAKKDRKKLGAKWWRRAHLYENGDVLAIFEGLGLIKLDKASNLIWARKNNAHHDLEVLPSGDIYVLTREPKMIPWVDPVEPTLEDFLSILDAEGNEKRRISILEAFRQSPYKDYVFQSVTKVGDVTHTNTIHVLDGSVADRIPAFREGNVLTSMNGVGVVAVLDLESEALTWAQKTFPHGRHDPMILANGNLLVFENHWETGQSIVAELSLDDLEPVWEYRGTPEQPFHSRTCGAIQRLANGNTLITESDGGRAFEVTADQRIVWEYYTPHRAGDNEEFIATLAEVVRLPPDFPTDWLRSLVRARPPGE